MKPRFYRSVPNVLSMLRLALAPLFPFCPEAYWLLLILVSGISDVLDGWLARRWQAQSWLGGIIDAVADKLFVCTALLTMAAHGKFVFAWVPFLLLRDLFVAFTAIYAVCIRSWSSFKQMEVRRSGKLATGAQFGLLLAVAFTNRANGFILWTAAGLSFVAACDYGHLFIDAVRRRAAEKASHSDGTDQG